MEKRFDFNFDIASLGLMFIQTIRTIGHVRCFSYNGILYYQNSNLQRNIYKIIGK